MSKILHTSECTSDKTGDRVNGFTSPVLTAKPKSRLKRFVSLGLADQVLLLRALFLVSAIRLGLYVLPFRVLQRFAQRETRKSGAAHSPRQYVWSVRAVSRCVPGATCLTQALATQALLSRSGHDSRIEIGVNKDEERRFQAHAWVVCGEQIVIGGAEADRYTRLAAWTTKPTDIDKP